MRHANAQLPTAPYDGIEGGHSVITPEKCVHKRAEADGKQGTGHTRHIVGHTEVRLRKLHQRSRATHL